MPEGSLTERPNPGSASTTMVHLLNRFQLSRRSSCVKQSGDEAPVGTLSRGLHLMSCVAAAGSPPGLTALARMAKLDKATTYRLASKLVSLGYLDQTPGGRFRLGLRILSLGYAYLNSLDIRARALPEMRRVQQEIDGTVSLCVLDGAEIVYLERLAPKRLQASLPVGIGARLPVQCTAMGKAILAEMPPGDRQRVLQKIVFKQFTPRSIHDQQALMKDLEQVRSRGFATSDNEMVIGLRAVASAIKDHNGVPVAALSIALSADLVTSAQLRRTVGPHVRAAAAAISRSGVGDFNISA